MEALVLWHRVAPSAHDEEADASVDFAWLKYVRATAEQSGGTVLGPVGGALAVIMDAVDIEVALNLALGILDAADRSPDFSATPRVALGAALGEIDFAPSGTGREVIYVGAALDRAQLLANRARAGELVLDTRAREASQHVFLFHRTVGTGEASLRGHAIDREEPRIADCRRHFVHLTRPPTPQTIADAFSPMREDASVPGSRCVVIRGEAGSGSRRALAELEFAMRPSLVLRCVGVPSGLEPLGSMRAALQRAYGPGAARLSRLAALDLGTADTLGRIARGEAVEIDAARRALVELLQACREPDTNKPWLVLDSDDVDESTLEIIGKIARDPSSDVLTVVNVSVDTAVPGALTRAYGLREITVPTLRFDEVRALVERMLREQPGGDIARRVAATGAKTPLAAVECVRAWIASGDVVRRGRSFVFRIGPRPAGERGAYADWATERVSLLDPDAGRALELLASTPQSLPGPDLEALALADGFTAQSFERAVARLSDDKFVQTTTMVELENPVLRSVIRARMPAGRKTDLASVVATRFEGQAPFGRATFGHYLAESGQSQLAAETFLDIAESAIERGHDRACIRLASAAVQASPSQTIRARAAALLRGATLRVDAADDSATLRRSVEMPVEAFDSPARIVVAALRERDFDRVDQFVDLAIAEGASLAAADRLRAIVSFLRGDPAETQAALARARGRGAGPTSDARTDAFAALVDVSEGHRRAALRTLLTTLASVRAAADTRSEAGVLHALSLCYEAFGRPDAALRLLERSRAVLTAS